MMVSGTMRTGTQGAGLRSVPTQGPQALSEVHVSSTFDL